MSDVVHLKGFARGVPERADWDAAALAYILRETHPSMIVTDGDAYRSDSFTRLIPLLDARLPSSVQFHFRRLRGRPPHPSWAGVALRRPIQWSESETTWSEDEEGFIRHGLSNLERTNATHIVCFGGGACTREEVRRWSPSPGRATVVRWFHEVQRRDPVQES